MQPTARKEREGALETLLGRASLIGESIDLRPWRAFALLSAFYLLATIALSHFKLLWLDELITVHIAKLGSAGAIWQALSHGADPNPPLTHLLVMASYKVFGAHTYAFRLPAVAGYWVGMLALFLFAKRLTTPTWALVTVLMSMGMVGFEWSYESRSYALIYGTTMLAVHLWSVSTEPALSRAKKSAAVAGMALALATGLCCNYFSVLAFVPVAVGELVRTMQSVWWRRNSPPRAAVAQSVRWTVWLALAIALAPLVMLRSLVERAIAMYLPYAWNRVSFDATGAAYEDMVGAMLIPLGLLAVTWVVLCFFRKYGADERHRATDMQQTDRIFLLSPVAAKGAAALCLVLYPYLGWALATLHGGMLSPRFVIPVCFGMAIAGGYLGFRALGTFRSSGPAFLLFFLFWFTGRESWTGYGYSEQRDGLYKLFDALQTVDHAQEAIAVTDNLLVLPFQYYAPADVSRRVYYPMDVTATMNRRHEASAEVNLWHGRDLYGFNIMPLAEFHRSQESYFLVTSEPDWLLDDLHAHDFPVKVVVPYTRSEPLTLMTTPISHHPVTIFRVAGGLNRSVDAPGIPWIDPLPLTVPFDLQGEVPRDH
ncbi:MAG: ArnT family glycosyltransferase [Janthinobacterium lividum]